MKIEYRESLPDQKDFIHLYHSAGWTNPLSEEQLYRAISQSWYTLSVYAVEQLVGFGRIISDGIYQALLCDVIVLPGYQNRGIGKNIVQRLLHKCQSNQIVMVLLFSAKGKADFYKKFGFVERSADAPGMWWHGFPEENEK
ncbi:GNAT family N-acetyltransferase [Lihuaxuella thermophila]|uniref:N-acetylglutamate synthase, GNAT family n=1 Tax=Lihuaxuella thermophila TaxID=1173111 RepID=A0A1H8JMD7_9BACL|nr:GNAT family N-acetyltransferase [Lihuaxuella thermophila]SEN81842.1 N-acetylglutamate synthase, GNAT family [Lihuaxuella thermophila]